MHLPTRKHTTCRTTRAASSNRFGQPPVQIAPLRLQRTEGDGTAIARHRFGVPDSRIVTIASNADAISTVSTGRADAYAGTGLTVSELAGQGANVEVVADFVDPVVDGEEVRSWGAFAFAQGSTALRDAVNGALAEFKSTDEWRATIAGYGFTEADIEHSTDRTTQELCTAN